MRPIVLTAFLLLGYVTSASAQTASRFEIGPVVRLDHVFVEGDMTGRSTVAGVVGTFKLSKTFGVEGEITQASNQLQQSREGWFVSYVTTPNPTREEIERMAPTVLIARGLEPGIGWSAAFVARGDVVPRVSLAARVGLSARDYLESETYRFCASRTAWIRSVSRMTTRTGRSTGRAAACSSVSTARWC